MPSRELEPSRDAPAAAPPEPAAIAPTLQAPDARRLLALQQSAGNAAVARLLARADAPSDAPPTATASLLVDDDAAPGAGQQRKGEFLDALHTALCSAAEAAFAGTPWTAAGCPWIEHWIARYRLRDAATVEQAARRFAAAAGSAASAGALIPVLSARLAAGIAEWRETGQWGDAAVTAELGAMPDAALSAPAGEPAAPAAAGAAPAGDRVAAKPLEGRSTGEADPRVLRAGLGAGRPLDSGVAARMGGAFGRDFGRVRLHTDPRAARAVADLGARAFTVGEHVAFGAGQYEPGTPTGDALIAHELAHVLQQDAGAATEARGQGGVGYDALEADADRSALHAVAALWDRGTSGFVPRLRSGLRLQSCRGCGTETAPLIDRLRAISDPSAVESELRDLTPAQITELTAQAPPGTLLGDGLAWESALRTPNWQRLATLHREDTRNFFDAYRTRVVERIVANKTPLRIDTDRAFATWVEGQVDELARGRVGFRLLVELLATGQTVNLRPTAGENVTQRDFTEADPDAGRWVTTDGEGRLLPVAQQHAGAATGSTIELNTQASANQVSIGGTAAAPRVIDMDATATFAHELIHALHNARGENTAGLLSAPLARAAGGIGLVRDPVTGESVSPEELRTITGQTRFGRPQEARGQMATATEFNLPADGITENAIRAERRLDERITHMGAARAVSIAAVATDTADTILNRYRIGGGAVPPALREAIRGILVSPDWYPLLASRPLGTAMDPLPIPHPDYVKMYLRFVARQVPLADAAEGLSVTGGR